MMNRLRRSNPIPKTKLSPTVENARKLIEQTLDANKATDIISINLVGKSSFADYMVIASATSQRHVGALAGHVAEKLKENGIHVLSIEGQEACDWVLIDAGDIIVHIFKPESRQFYNLEKMWAVSTPLLEAVN